MSKHWYLMGRAQVPVQRRLIGTLCAAAGTGFLAIQLWRAWQPVTAVAAEGRVSPVETTSTASSVAALAAVGLTGVLIALVVVAVWRAIAAPNPVSPTDESRPRTGITIEGEVLKDKE